jgi:hypothetical protein
MPWTTPGTAVAGDVLTAAFWNSNVRDNSLELAPFFSAWTSYTPTISQVGNVTKTTTYAKYLKIGRLAIVSFRLDVIAGTAGTAGTFITISLPTAVVPTATNVYGGLGLIYDASTGISYSGVWQPGGTTTTLQFAGDWSGGTYWGAQPSIGLLTNDQIHGLFICETTT